MKKMLNMYKKIALPNFVHYGIINMLYKQEKEWTKMMKRLSYTKIAENTKRFFSIIRKFKFSYILLLLFSFLFILSSLMLCFILEAYILMIIIVSFILMGGLLQDFSLKYDQYNKEKEKKP